MDDISHIIKEWPTSRLRIETADLLKIPRYLIMTADQKREQDLPVTNEEMRDFIIKKVKELDDQP